MVAMTRRGTVLCVCTADTKMRLSKLGTFRRECCFVGEAKQKDVKLGPTQGSRGIVNWTATDGKRWMTLLPRETLVGFTADSVPFAHGPREGVDGGRLE